MSLVKWAYSHSFDIALAVLSVSAIAHFLRTFTKRKELPLPPGPRPLPIVQNLLDMPRGQNEGPFFAKHKDKYGPISSLTSFGTTIVILNDMQVAFDLLDKRSAIYSNRPHFHFGNIMAGFGSLTSQLQYTPILRQHRKEMQNYIGTKVALDKHASVLQVETHRFLYRMVEEPNDLFQHIRTTAGAIILSISHGYTIAPKGRDPFVDNAQQTLDAFSDSCLTPWTVDFLPFLEKLPDWLPGMGFKKIAQKYREILFTLVDRPTTFVKRQLAAGVAKPSFLAELLQKGITSERESKWIVATLYGGGADTSVSGTKTFFLAMLLYPEVFRKLQEEVDSVVGRDRLPTLADRDRLPYTNAVTLETFRWQNIAPLHLPHVASEDDEYRGYRIPKGAIVFPNDWQMCHEPTHYPSPFEFNPDRFLGEVPQPDPRSIVFGFGRRACPGRVLADSAVYSTISMTAATMDLRKAQDSAGCEIVPEIKYSAGMVSHPAPFPYHITPRDAHAEALIRTVADQHPFDFSDAEFLKTL